MKFKIITLGCKVNTYESEYIREDLLKNNYLYDEKKPDIIIINTCSVTNTADHKSLKIVRRERRKNPDKIIVVCGCSSQNDLNKYQDLNINILLGNVKKSEISKLLNDYLKTKENYTYVTKNRKLPFEPMQVSNFTTHTRAFLKIEDGCDNFCSYCIIPFTRGSIRCKDFNSVIKEATALSNSHQEIVLTGINTGAYKSNNQDLSDLLVALTKIPRIKRIRISSIEITEIDSKFLNVLAQNPKICHHLHIPLQSGSKNVLKLMNRKYDKEYFQEKIKQIRSIIPDISITTDCIVGHPKETEEDFLECLAFCKSLNFSKIHVFPFSKREGTKSAMMEQIDVKTKKERVKKLIALSCELEKSYSQKFINHKLEVLTEDYEANYLVGHTSNYLKVYLPNNYQPNHNYLCLITDFKDNKLYGEVIICENFKITV